MYPCQKCGQNSWKFGTGGKIINKGKEVDKWIVAICFKCGHKIEFGHKIKVIKNECAEYKIKKGKRYLKIDGKYKEVYLKYFDDGSFKVMPVENLLIKN